MKVHYSSDGELSGILELETLIRNLGEHNDRCGHGDAIDLVSLRRAMESGREFRGYHDFGKFVVMPACKFTFDDETEYDGFAHGSTWNGFDNVAVTKETMNRIEANLGGDESESNFGEIEPMENGLYSLGWGFATNIVEEHKCIQHRDDGRGFCIDCGHVIP